MSLTAVAFILVYVILLCLSMIRGPMWGLYAYFLAFYQLPSNYWWGTELPDLRWSFVAAAVTFCSALLDRGTGPRTDGSSTLALRPWYSTFPARCMIALCAWMWLELFWAINVPQHMEGAALYSKYVLLFALLYMLVNTPRRMETLFWCHIVGCFVWGWIAYTTEVRGRLDIALSPEGADSNLIGYHMATGLAFAGFMFVQLKGLKRWVVFAASPFILNAIILTASRGATLGLLAAGVSSVLFAPRAKRFPVYAACLLAIPLMLRLAGNDIFWERMGTLTQTDPQKMEGSAASRIPIIEANWRMFLDHPFGVGYRSNMFLSPQYMSDNLLTTAETGQRLRAAHNSFMASLVDYGVPGGLFMLGMVGWSFARLVRMKCLDRRGLPSDLGAYRAALAAGLTANLVTGQFINLQKTETWFWMLAAVGCLDQMCTAHLRVADADSHDNKPGPS